MVKKYNKKILNQDLVNKIYQILAMINQTKIIAKF